MNKAKLTAEQIAEIQAKYANGMTQKALAAEYKVSQALIQKRCGGPYRSYNTRDRVRNIKYAGIREYLANNYISIRKFAKMAELNYVSLYYDLIGKNDPRKQTIDKILKCTGLTYEKAFGEKDE